MQNAANRMFELFRGHTGGHGTYGNEEKSPGKAKSEIKKTARTLREPPTPALWQQHLEGTRPIGIIPVNNIGMCWWGVIDVDKYDLDHASIVKAIERMKLPMIVCRSKSGGAHIFMFLKESVSAVDLITKLKQIAVFLGFGSSEIFPKQTEILEDRGDLGNWLNMPYFNAEGGTRYAVTNDGRGLSIDRFLDLAFKTRLTEEEFHAVSPGKLSVDGDLSEAPPCLQYLATVGVGDGSKHNALLAFGILAKKIWHEGWDTKLAEWNQKFILPPAASPEDLLGIIKHLRKKDYVYKCKDQPLASHCDSRACRNRKYGIGSGSAPDITSISVLDTQPPLFFVCLNSGGTVECQSDDILSSRNFQKAALEQLKIVLPLFKNDVWLDQMQKCLEQAIIIDAPKEVGSSGALHELLEEFCTDRHSAKDKDEILLGKPWLDEDKHRYWFRLSDFTSHLEKAKFRDFRRSQIVSRIKELGGDHGFFNMRGRGVNVWWVPASAFSVQSEPHTIPRSEESPI